MPFQKSSMNFQFYRLFLHFALLTSIFFFLSLATFMIMCCFVGEEIINKAICQQRWLLRETIFICQWKHFCVSTFDKNWKLHHCDWKMFCKWYFQWTVSCFAKDVAVEHLKYNGSLPSREYFSLDTNTKVGVKKGHKSCQLWTVQRGN